MLHRMLTSVHLSTSGCDTTSKVGTKRVAYQAAINVDYGLLHSLGKEIIAEEMVRNIERFFVHFIEKSVVFQDLMACRKRLRFQK